MPRYLDLEHWPRRGAFEFFRAYDNPYFNVCAPLDATALLAHTRAEGFSFSIACIHLALHAANECEPFRYRLEAGRVLVHERIHGGSTTLLEGDELAFVYFDYDEDFRRVQAQVRQARQAARARGPASSLDHQDHRSDLLHFSTLPWIAFTGLTNARKWGLEDSVPKITFGRYQVDAAGRVRLPMAVEVHHALMDGVHVGRFFTLLQERFDAAAARL